MQQEYDFAASSQFGRQAAEMSGATPTAGMPPYPLYGVPGMGQTEEVPFYRNPIVCVGFGAAAVGAAWLYFGWWRPKQQKKKVSRNRRPALVAEDDE